MERTKQMAPCATDTVIPSLKTAHKAKTCKMEISVTSNIMNFHWLKRSKISPQKSKVCLNTRQDSTQYRTIGQYTVQDRTVHKTGQ
jgi:hypothetical protein